MESSNYRKIFKEISQGYSSYFVKSKRRFIKHQSLNDVVDFDDIYDMNLKKAIKRGLPTEEEILENLKSEGLWEDSDESELESQSFFVESLRKNKKNVYLKSGLEKINNQIKEAEEKLSELKLKKQNLMSNSANRYALNRANDYYIVNSFFKDDQLSEKLYSDHEFEYASTQEVSELIKTYNEFHQRFSENNIKHLAIQQFYKVYYSFSENLLDFFGVPVVKLTNFQLNLILYTRIFKNIFDQFDKDLPDRLKEDPDGLLDFANSSETREKMKKELSKNSAGSTIVGATKEDLEEMGIQGREGGESLNKLAKEKGGSLSMQDLMKLNGIK